MSEVDGGDERAVAAAARAAEVEGAVGRARHPESLLRPGREITGLSAVLLPFDAAGSVDWHGFTGLLERTVAAGLTPAVNMDTGYVALLDDATATRVLDIAADVVGPGFVAGAFVRDEPGASFDPDAHRRALEPIVERSGAPVLFQSFGLATVPDAELAAAYRTIARGVPSWIGFELGEVFAPFGRIWSLATYRDILDIESCIGAKHSSLHRVPEWQRLALRDEVRPAFHVFTGNDLAIDMVRYGSDYLLGLSAAAPDLFARRDRWLRSRDPRAHELEDALQALGDLAFRDPVPAYKSSVATFLHLRGWIDHDGVHPDATGRPASDRPILEAILARCLAAAGA